MIKIAWPNGGMGNSIYTLLCACTHEINASVQQEQLETSGLHWHDVSRYLKTDLIVKVHPEVPIDAITVGSNNFYFIKLLSWAKWAGYPVINTAEELEQLHLFLNDWAPSVTEPDFEITKLFKDTAVEYVANFIRQIGLTPNQKIETIVKYLVKNNVVYYNKIKYLEQIAQDTIDNKYTSIVELNPYEQALLMTMIYHQTGIHFKLVHAAFRDTQDILDNMENING